MTTLLDWYIQQVFNTYGKYEIRCKLPKGKQQWPAFWLFGWNTEIDIFEFICRGPDKLEFSIHNWMTEHCPDPKRPESGAPCYTSPSGVVDFGIDFSKDFHTFSMEYEPHIIKFYIELVENSKSRVGQSNDFNLILERALKVKEEKDLSKYPLKLNSYRAMVDKRDEDAKKYENLLKNDIAGLDILNIEKDLAKINMDDPIKPKMKNL